MKKTSLYLDPSLDEALAKRAADEGLSKAEFIRRTLKGAVTRPKRPKLSTAVFEGPADMASNVDEHLRKSGFGKVERRP